MLLLKLGHHQRCIRATESEAVAEGDADRMRTRFMQLEQARDGGVAVIGR